MHIQMHGAVCTSCLGLELYWHDSVFLQLYDVGMMVRIFRQFPVLPNSFNLLCFHPPDSVESLSQHIAFWDSLEHTPWAVPPADKPGGSGGAVLNEVRLTLLFIHLHCHVIIIIFF